MVDRKMYVVAIKADERPVFVRQYSRTLGDVLEDLSLKRLGFSVLDMNGPKLAIALDNTDHNGLVRATLRAGCPLVRVFVLFLAADKSRIGFNIAFERRIERVSAGGMAKAMEHEPRGLLRDFQVLGERHASNTLWMVGNHPNRHKPLAEGKFRVLKNCADLDRKSIPAIATLERFEV